MALYMYDGFESIGFIDNVLYNEQIELDRLLYKTL
jgi:hypothetical protein